MPRISQITEDFAERFNFEPPRVAQVAKALRAQKLVQSGPRGINAPNASSLDAARLLIALMLRVKHDDAVDGVKLFGEFRALDAESVSIAGKVAYNFEEALALMLDYCGQDMDSEGGNAAFDDLEFSVRIHRDSCSAYIFMGQWADNADEADDEEPTFKREQTFTFLHPEVAPSLASGEFTPALRAIWRRYRTGFHEIPELSKNDLIAIGQVIAGRSPPLTAPLNAGEV